MKLYEMLAANKQEFCKELGIDRNVLERALQYCKFAEEEPELAKKVSPKIIIETASLPKEERKEVLKEFEGIKDKKKDLIRELVRDKKEVIAQKKEIEIKKRKIKNKKFIFSQASYQSRQRLNQ